MALDFLNHAYASYNSDYFDVYIHATAFHATSAIFVRFDRHTVLIAACGQHEWLQKIKRSKKRGFLAKNEYNFDPMKCERLR